MIGIGTLVNTGAILVGGGVGLLLKKGIPQRFQNIIFTATGTGTFLIAVTGVITACVTADGAGALSSSFGMTLLLSLVLGGITGELLRLDRGFEKAGEWIRGRLGGGGNAGAGFAGATILFCSGAMAILGSMQDAVLGDPSLLYTKAILDGITALIFTTVYGPSVLLAAGSVLVYQGSITLIAALAGGGLPAIVITQMGLVGNAVLLLLAFSLWDIKKFNVANLIPATFFPILLHSLGL